MDVSFLLGLLFVEGMAILLLVGLIAGTLLYIAGQIKNRGR